MKILRSLRLEDKYKVELSKYPDERGKYIVFHYTRTLKGCSCQRVFKGSYKECQTEKTRLEEEMKKNRYIKRKVNRLCG